MGNVLNCRLWYKKKKEQKAFPLSHDSDRNSLISYAVFFPLSRLCINRKAFSLQNLEMLYIRKVQNFMAPEHFSFQAVINENMYLEHPSVFTRHLEQIFYFIISYLFKGFTSLHSFAMENTQDFLIAALGTIFSAGIW